MIDLLILEAKAIIYEQKALWNERNIMLADLENAWNRYRNNFFREK